MDFTLSARAQVWRDQAHLLGKRLNPDASPSETVRLAAGLGLVDAEADLLSAVVAIEALASEAAAQSLALALHLGVVMSASSEPRLALRLGGATVGAMALSTEDLPVWQGGLLGGRASWVGPITAGGVAVVGARSEAQIVACAVALDAPGVTVEPIATAGLAGCTCGHVRFEAVPCDLVGATVPFMARARVLLAGIGLGLGRHALREALESARGLRGRGAGGEQTVQGLLADAATELDAAMLLTWKAASRPTLSLAEASMAKLAATEAAQGAVARATQIVGAESFRRGHRIEQLARDVRALELFAGRTEALREAVAEELAP